MSRPSPARMVSIERLQTILLGYPLPKIFLFQKTDLKSKKSVKEIVDGQQRSKTIYEFFSNKLTLSKRSEIESARGKTYDQIGEDLQGQFLNYQLSIDLFVSVSPADIRQAFRRLNSYTVPLNPEELRHADYQGEFKWFIYNLTREHEEAMLQLGVFGEKQIIRMADTKLFAECVYALMFGIKTTRAKDLDNLYKSFEKDFSEGDAIRALVNRAISVIVELNEIHKGPLMKPFIFYALLIAVIQCFVPVAELTSVFDVPLPYEFERDVVVTNLSGLADALETDTPDPKYRPFVDACSSKTNVEAQKVARIQWLGRALQPTLL